MEYKERQDEELLKFKGLLTEVERWKALKEIRSYISEFEQVHQRNAKLTPEVEEKINWMKQKADWYDPHINLEDELLAALDKNTLQFKRSESTYW